MAKVTPHPADRFSYQPYLGPFQGNLRGIVGATNTVFISYSHKNQRWLDRVLVHLNSFARANQIDPWSDRRLKPGDEWEREIAAALARASVGVLLVSADFLASDFISRVELPSLLQSAAKRGCKIVPIILGPCGFSSMQNLRRFQAVNPPDKPLEGMRKNQAEAILAAVASTVGEHLSRRARRPCNPQSFTPGPAKIQQTFIRDPRVDRIIADVGLADWAAAEQAALRIVAETQPSGVNELFEALLNYQDTSSEEESLWGALQTIECCVRLAPWLIAHSQLSQMAAHKNFSVRSSAAAICMDLAHSAPDRVPLDLVMKLSVYDEDWYVRTPANSALKAMARTTPEVLRIFHMRLRSSNVEESTHSAGVIMDLADKEPEVLDPQLLRRDLVLLKKSGNVDAARQIRMAISKAAKVRRRKRYRYGF